MGQGPIFYYGKYDILLLYDIEAYEKLCKKKKEKKKEKNIE